MPSYNTQGFVVLLLFLLYYDKIPCTRTKVFRKNHCYLLSVTRCLLCKGRFDMDLNIHSTDVLWLILHTPGKPSAICFV